MRERILTSTPGGLRPIAILLAAGAAIAATAVFSDVPATYKGKPYGGTPRSIPGRIDFEDYDLGGLNVAWKSDDKAGQGVAPGSTAANRADDGEKDHPAFYITNSNPGEVDKLPDGTLYPSPENPKSIYIGAAHATDYANVTVNVAQAGTYWLSAHFASQPNEIKLHVSFNGVSKTGTVTLAGTNDYHAWRYYKNFAKVELEAGIQVMQFMLDSYHLNWDYLSFASDTNGVAASIAPRFAAAPGAEGFSASMGPVSADGSGLLRFNLPQGGEAGIAFLDPLGKEIAPRVDRSWTAGMHSLPVRLTGSGSAKRFVRITHNGSVRSLEF